MRHPWHELSPGSKLPEFVEAVIEIPRGSKGKFELDKKTGMIRLDRVLFSAVHYPANYGFIPRTYCEDKDPLDILVFSSIEMPPLTVVSAKIIGVMRMLDQGEADDKIIAVAEKDMSVNHIDDIHQMPPHAMKELRRFFEDYKKLENKEVVVEDILHKEKAFEILRDSLQLYRKMF
nr:inorganic diphosphatase [Saprospiraceae bacterium]